MADKIQRFTLGVQIIMLTKTVQPKIQFLPTNKGKQEPTQNFSSIENCFPP
jgi:hypothetical protein